MKVSNIHPMVYVGLTNFSWLLRTPVNHKSMAAFIPEVFFKSNFPLAELVNWRNGINQTEKVGLGILDQQYTNQSWDRRILVVFEDDDQLLRMTLNGMLDYFNMAH